MMHGSTKEQNRPLSLILLCVYIYTHKTNAFGGLREKRNCSLLIPNNIYKHSWLEICVPRGSLFHVLGFIANQISMLFLSFDERWNSISNNDAWGFLAESNCWYTCGRNPMGFFYILSFKEEALSLNHLNRAIRFIAISYVYHPDKNTNKSHNLNTATRPNVLYESFFSNWLNRVYICSFP